MTNEILCVRIITIRVKQINERKDMCNKTTIVVLDSGLDIKNNLFLHDNIHGFSLNENNGKYTISSSFSDSIGHGTAVASIIKNSTKNTTLIPFRIFTKEKYYIEEEGLIYALEFINKNIKCDIINISLGTECCTELSRLKSVINDLVQKEIIIVSAYSNTGVISYPAALPNVIGVDSSDMCITSDDYIYVENSILNFRAKGNNQRLAWLDNQFIVVSGNSFAAPHITAKLTNIMINENLSPKDALVKLKEKATLKSQGEKVKVNYRDYFKINNAILFPFNKEMHSIIKFRHLLDFTINDVYDLRISGNVGKKLSKYNAEKITVKNIDHLDWNSNFDTIILGHTDKLQKLTKKDITKEIIEQCEKHQKNIFSFDYLNRKEINNDIHFYSPYINTKDLPINQYGKLYRISKPVLGIFGTGSKQGKFTLQLLLRERFLNDNYNVGQLGTEPSSELYGFDYVYPMGYNNSVNLKGFDCINLLNKQMNLISEKDCDIILVGSQSNTVPIYLGNEFCYTNKQLEFLQGTEPDGVILCINAHDEFHYISRTISVIENLIDTKVIASVIFPYKLPGGWLGANNILRDISKTDIERTRNYIERKHKIKLFTFSNNDISELYDLCINYFSEAGKDE